MDLKRSGTAMDSLCVICQAITEEPHIDIYKTQTDHSRCLLSEFITKTAKIMFERDKIWSKTLCRKCYNLIIKLDQAEVEYIKLKNDFIDVISKNKLIAALSIVNASQPIENDKIQIHDVPIKTEVHEDFDIDFSPCPATPMDSDDEPLLGRSAKNKNVATDDAPLTLKEESIKCEFDEYSDKVAKQEIFVCRMCKQEFDSKPDAAVHAFSVHQVDVTKDPGVIKVKSGVGKDGKKRRGRKKGKRKSFADLIGSDMDDPDKDKDWLLEKEVVKQNARATRNSKKNQGKVLEEPVQILGDSSSILKKALKKSINDKALQKKLASGSVTIKKMQTNAPSLHNPIPIIPLDGDPGDGMIIKTEDGDKMMEIVEDGVMKALPGMPFKVKTEKRQYIKKQKPQLQCPQCPATFTSQNRMDLHMVKHTGTLSPYICEICGAAYKHKKACDIHVEMHKGISPWKCNLCDKIFPSKGALCRHEAIHTGTPNYQCDLCGKSFIHTSSFKMHKLSHSGLKPHTCNKCGLSLMTRSHLKRHQRVHSGEKRHECTTCGKKFSERYNLYAHQKSHDPSGVQVQRQLKTHDCTVCDASFNRRYVLEKHMETAHQRVMEPIPKKTRNTMTKLLKQQALIQQQQQLGQAAGQTNTSDSHDMDVKLLISKTPSVHNTDSTSSSFIGESSFQHAGSSAQNSGLIVVTKEELPDVPAAEVSQGRTTANVNSSTNASTASAAPSASIVPYPSIGIAGASSTVVWQGLYQLANENPLRMYGVDSLGRTGH